MLRTQIWQATIFSLLILAAVMAVDFLINGVLFSSGKPYDGWTTVIITLLVAPPFSFFLINQNAKMQNAQVSLAAERAERLIEVEKARDAAEAATRAKSEFLANMSHEIRTPLNGVLGMTQALVARELDSVSRDMVATIQESGNSLMAILNDVLDLSKIEAGRMDVSPVDGRLMHTLEQVHKLFLPKAEEKGIELRLSGAMVPDDRIRFDPVRVRQCMSNLVSNAVKFTREGRVDVDVSFTPAEGGRTKVAISVVDTGIGMDRQALGRLFEAFTQADGSTTRQFGGTGLGLTISRRLARLMGGDIVASSTPGIGSVFTFSFIADAIQGSAASPETRAELERSVRLRGAHVLLTDDNAINRQVARLFLQPQGAIITEACNGQEALDALAAGEFDLLLLDVHMPVMDGKQTIQRIRSSGAAWNRLPVLALTADAMSGDRERLLALGMSGYVSKPIDQSELLAEIGRVLGGGGIIAPLTDAPKASVAAEAFDDLLGDLDKIVNG